MLGSELLAKEFCAYHGHPAVAVKFEGCTHPLRAVVLSVTHWYKIFYNKLPLRCSMSVTIEHDVKTMLGLRCTTLSEEGLRFGSGSSRSKRIKYK